MRTRQPIPSKTAPVTHYEHHLSAGAGADWRTAFWATTGYNAPSPVLDVHTHEGMELGLVLTGVEEVHFGEQVFHQQPGDVWLCGAWEPHGWRITTPETSNFVIIFLPLFVGDEMLGSLSWTSLFSLPPEERHQLVGEPMRPRVLAIGEKLRWELTHRPPMWERAVRLEVSHLLLELVRGEAALHARRGGPYRPRSQSLDRILPAIVLVNSDPSRQVSVAEAAAACGVSPSRFRHLFRETIGLSFGAFALRARLAFCARCLLATNLTVSAIADRAGFVDASHLHHAFVQYYGRTPGDFRQEGRFPQSLPQPSVGVDTADDVAGARWRPQV